MKGLPRRTGSRRPRLLVASSSVSLPKDLTHQVVNGCVLVSQHDLPSHCQISIEFRGVELVDTGRTFVPFSEVRLLGHGLDFSQVKRLVRSTNNEDAAVRWVLETGRIDQNDVVEGLSHGVHGSPPQLAMINRIDQREKIYP